MRWEEREDKDREIEQVSSNRIQDMKTIQNDI